MKQVYFISYLLLTIVLCSTKAHSIPGDQGKIYGIANVGMARTATKMVMNGTFVDTPVYSQSKKTDTSPIFEAGIGYYLTDSFRTDLSLLYSAQQYNHQFSSYAVGGSNYTPPPFSIKIRTWGALWNVAYELFTYSKFTPYISTGAGYLYDNSKNLEKKEHIAYQLGAGLNYNISKNIDLLVGYKYLGYDSYISGKESYIFGTANITYKKKGIHSAQLGIKLKY